MQNYAKLLIKSNIKIKSPSSLQAETVKSFDIKIKNLNCCDEEANSVILYFFINFVNILLNNIVGIVL